MNNFPSFFVVGAAKSGTSALWNYFQQHPEIFVTNDIRIKELGYFSNQYGITDKNEYKKYFSAATEKQIIGEVCHAYISSSESADWIKKEVPHAKIIIILRNPIDRAYSLYNWMTMEGYENAVSFKKSLNLEKERHHNSKSLLHSFNQNYHYFESGLYYHQVKRYLNVFGKDNVLILAYEEFNKDQLFYLNSIYKFLGVSSIGVLNNQRVNKSRSVISIKMHYFFRKLLIKYYNRPKIKKVVSKLMQLNAVDKKPKKLSKYVRNELKIKYEKDVSLLSDLCNYNFNKLWFK
jgi:hypothetical protein